MELRLNLNYKQILGLIHQLPKRDIERLAITLQTEISKKEPVKSMQELILNAPIWSDTDIDNFKAARKNINKSRVA